MKQTTIPLPGPLFGFYGQLTARKHYQFSIGMQYQMIGKYYHYHRDGNDLLYNANYTSDEWENQTFHKLCVPLTVGFTFRIHKVHPSIFIGYRPNFFLTGRYYYKYNLNHDDNTKDLITERKLNPFDPDQCKIQAKHFNKQFIFGLSVSSGQHLEFMVSIIPGQIISYAEYKPYYNGFTNSDLLLSIKYKILQSTKEISTTDKKLAALNNVYKILPKQ
ncbi:MAG: hypothetical protein KAX05_13425 [Bacteroidales bacterium]|nr:hypothetical protein [Bacteroidales bacterium]